MTRKKSSQDAMTPLPCPFCGAKPNMYYTTPGNIGGQHFIRCVNKYCLVSPSTWGRWPTEALMHWNTRYKEHGKSKANQ